jgi:hypothetical protein
LLSLILVAGSCFRNKDRTKCGWDGRGQPVDARHLFDKNLFEERIQSIFQGYYQGFCGRPFRGPMPFCPDALTERLIEAMGVDHHMEELLRIEDQRRLTEDVFRAFLIERGYSRTQAKRVPKGAEDIRLYTGPHLGGFNERISVPELIEAVAAMSAFCVAGKYWMERSASP